MGVVIVEGEGPVLGVNLGHAIVTSEDGDALFPNYFGEHMLLIVESFFEDLVEIHH